MGCGGSAVMDLEPIEERANEFATWVGKFDSEHRIPAAFASAADVPALLAEVERLRAEVDRLRAEVRLAKVSAHSASLALGAQLAARPDPAWDEEAVAEAVRKDLEAVGILPWTNGGARIVRTVLAVVREHLPVKPSREEVARALALVGDYDGCFERLDAWAAASSEARECGDVEEPMSTDGEDAEWWLKRADAILDLLPGRTESEVKAEALNEAADWLADMDDGRDTGQHRAGRDIIARLRDRADRLGGSS